MLLIKGERIMYDEEVFKKLVIGWLVMLPLGLFGGLVGLVTITVSEDNYEAIQNK